MLKGKAVDVGNIVCNDRRNEVVFGAAHFHIGVFRHAADGDHHAEVAVGRTEQRRLVDRGPAVCVLGGLRLGRLAAVDLQLVVLGRDPLSHALRIVDAHLAHKVCKVERLVGGVVHCLVALVAGELYVVELLLLDGGDGGEGHVHLVAVQNGVELHVGIFIGHLDARDERCFVRNVFVDELDDVVGTEGPRQTDLARCLGIGARAHDIARGIHRPVAPLRGIGGHIAGVVIPARRRVVVIRRIRFGMRAVVVIFGGAAHKPGKQTGAEHRLARIADAVHQNESVVTDDNGHAAVVAVRDGGKRRSRRIEIAQRDTDVREVPLLLVIGFSERRTRNGDGHALADAARRHRADGRRDGSALLNIAE